MAGVVQGVDLAAALARVDCAGLDPAAIAEIAARGETGLLKGLADAGGSRPAKNSR